MCTTPKIPNIPDDITRCEEPNSWVYTLGKSLFQISRVQVLILLHAQTMDPTALTMLLVAVRGAGCAERGLSSLLLQYYDYLETMNQKATLFCSSLPLLVPYPLH